MATTTPYSEDECIALISPEIAKMTPDEMEAHWIAAGWPDRGGVALSRQRLRYRKRAGLPDLDNRASERSWTPPGGAPLDLGDPTTSRYEDTETADWHPWAFGDLCGDQTREEIRAAACACEKGHQTACGPDPAMAPADPVPGFDRRSAPRAPHVRTQREAFESQKSAVIAAASSGFRVRGLVGDAATKIIMISDLHAPYTRHDLVKEILRVHADADVVVLGGDLMDADAPSSFPQHRRMPLIDEYREVFDLVDYCAHRFPRVVMIDGNHERRVGRMFTKLVPLEVTSIFETSPLSRIARGQKLDAAGRLVDMVRWSTRVDHYPEWCQIGDALFCHPDKYLGPTATIPGLRTAYLSARGAMRKRMDATVIVMPHTHHCGKMPIDGWTLIEVGCLCNRIPWEMRDSSLSKGQQDLGFGVLYQDARGRTDPNRSGYVYLGSKVPTADREPGPVSF